MKLETPEYYGEDDAVRACRMWDDRPGDWFVLHAKPRQEKLLCEELRRNDASVYLPLTKELRTYGHRKSSVMLPVMPGYLFFKGEKHRVYEADRVGRLLTVLPVADQQRLAWELNTFQTAIEGDIHLKAMRKLVPGTRVEIRSGPHSGQQGVIESDGRRDEMVVQMHFFGRAMPFNIEACNLVPIRDE